MTRALIGVAALAVIVCLSPPAAADLVYDFTAGDDGGFISSGTGTTNWTYTGTQWQTPGEDSTQSFLTSELVRATSSTVNVTLDHAYDFESPENFFDGGVLELSINGGAFNVVTPTGGYPTASVTMDGVDALGDIPGWSGDSGGTVTDTFALSVNSGDELQFRFHAAWVDSVLTPSPNWSLSSMTFENATANPEPSFAILLFCCVGGGIVVLRRRMRDGQHIPT